MILLFNDVCDIANIANILRKQPVYSTYHSLMQRVVVLLLWWRVNNRGFSHKHGIIMNSFCYCEAHRSSNSNAILFNFDLDYFKSRNIRILPWKGRKIRLESPISRMLFTFMNAHSLHKWVQYLRIQNLSTLLLTFVIYVYECPFFTQVRPILKNSVHLSTLLLKPFYCTLETIVKYDVIFVAVKDLSITGSSTPLKQPSGKSSRKKNQMSS